MNYGNTTEAVLALFFGGAALCVCFFCVEGQQSESLGPDFRGTVSVAEEGGNLETSEDRGCSAWLGPCGRLPRHGHFVASVFRPANGGVRGLGWGGRLGRPGRFIPKQRQNPQRGDIGGLCTDALDCAVSPGWLLGILLYLLECNRVFPQAGRF